MNIGMNIKNRREKLGITQKQMAENLSLTQSMIAQVERGTKIPNMILDYWIVPIHIFSRRSRRKLIMHLVI